MESSTERLLKESEPIASIYWHGEIPRIWQEEWLFDKSIWTFVVIQSSWESFRSRFVTNAERRWSWTILAPVDKMADRLGQQSPNSHTLLTTLLFDVIRKRMSHIQCTVANPWTMVRVFTAATRMQGVHFTFLSFAEAWHHVRDVKDRSKENPAILS